MTDVTERVLAGGRVAVRGEPLPHELGEPFSYAGLEPGMRVLLSDGSYGAAKLHLCEVIRTTKTFVDLEPVAPDRWAPSWVHGVAVRVSVGRGALWGSGGYWRAPQVMGRYTWGLEEGVRRVMADKLLPGDWIRWEPYGDDVPAQVLANVIQGCMDGGSDLIAKWADRHRDVRPGEEGRARMVVIRKAWTGGATTAPSITPEVVLIAPGTLVDMAGEDHGEKGWEDYDDGH